MNTVDNRRYYLLTLLPPLPAPGEPLPITLSEALGRLRQQGGRDLERLADALDAEARMREALDEWVLAAPGPRTAPSSLPPALAAHFDEERMAAAGEDTWVEAVWRAWYGLVAAVGKEIGSPLVARWTAWEAALREGLARRRGSQGGETASAPPLGADEDGAALEALLVSWDRTRERGRGERALGAALDAEELLERARLEFLQREAAPYSFSADELVSYLLRLRLLERRRRLDPEKGREILRQAAAL